MPIDDWPPRLQIDPTDGRTFFELRGLRVYLGTPAECDAAAVVVCVRLADCPDDAFPDNVHTACAGCGAAIYHRPHVPAAPPKICMHCVSTYVPRPERS